MEIKIKIKSGRIESEACPALLLLFNEECIQQNATPLNSSERTTYFATAQKLYHAGDFKGKFEETICVYPENSPAERLLLAGFGFQKGYPVQRGERWHLQQVIAHAAAAARQRNVSDLCIPLGGSVIEEFGCELAAQLIVEAVMLANYQFTKYKSEKKEKNTALASLVLLLDDPKKVAETEAGSQRGETIAHWTCFARDLQNTPPNELTPARFAKIAQEQARRAGLACEIFDEHKMKELKMGALLGVAQGSSNPPRFVILEKRFSAKNKNLETMIFVGKGVTFDSGGLSLKSPSAMEEMKYDMSGAAIVLASACAIAQLQIPVHLVCLIPMVENMPGSTAQRPSDVVRTHTGKTIEVADTDAEGRLILAEALAFASRYKPDAVIDLATLTGVIYHVLGDTAAGLFSNDDELASHIKNAASKTGERVWQLPLYPEFSKYLESEIADIRNTSAQKTGAGASKAAAFLSAFAEGYKWAHLDIAAVASPQKSSALSPKGGSGWGVRLLIELCGENPRSRLDR